MRALALAATVGAVAAMAVAAPAYARVVDEEATLSTSGGVSVAWHGNRARGCAQAGLCGYRGSLTVHPTTEGRLFLELAHGRPRSVFGELDPDQGTVARVQRREPGGAGPEACVDAVHVSLIDIFVSVPRRAGRPARVGLEGDDLTSGRCAGPDLTRVLSHVPRGRLSLALLRRGATTVDLSGRAPYANGRFSGTVTSTLRLHIGPVRRSPADEAPTRPARPHRGKLVRVADLHAVYRVTSFAGKVAASFRAAGPPGCAALDACGTSGAAKWSIRTGGGIVVIDAGAVLHRSERGLRAVLRAVGRRGFVDVEPSLAHEIGTTSVSLARPGATPCSDTTLLPVPEFSLREGSRLALLLGFAEATPSGPDIMRAGCPGPPGSSIFARGPVAASSAPVGLLARRAFELPLRGGDRFDDGVYRGAWRSRFAFHLRRVKLRLRIRLEREPR